MTIAVLVSSCDKFSATWPACCHGLSKYWPDRPWPLYFMSGHKKTPCGHIIHYGEDKSWSNNLLFALDHLRRDKMVEVILLVLDDMWLTEPVKTKILERYTGYLLDRKFHHIRLFPPKVVYSDGDFADDDSLYMFSTKEPYRTSLHAGLWRIDALAGLLRPGESAWKFEVRGSARSKDMTISCVKKPIAIRYINRNYGWGGEPVQRGKWTEAARKYAKREGLKIDFSRHPKYG